MKNLLIILAGLSISFVVLSSCNPVGYTALGSPTIPRNWSPLPAISTEDERINFDTDNTLAFNSDTWVYLDNNIPGIDHYARFLTFANPDDEGIGSYIDVEMEDIDGGSAETRYTDYTIRLGVYRLLSGAANPDNSMDLYAESVFYFRYTARSTPFDKDTGTFGSQVEQPWDTYVGRWTVKQNSATEMSIGFPEASGSSERMDAWINNAITNLTDPAVRAQWVARLLQVNAQATQTLHYGWNGYGEDTRREVILLGAIIEGGKLPGEYHFNYRAPLGQGSFAVEYVPPSPLLPNPYRSEILEYSPGYQIFSSILAAYISADDNRWTFRTNSGSGSGSAAGTIEFNLAGTGGAANSVSLDYGEIKPIGDTSTAVTDMILSSDYELTWWTGSTPSSTETITPTDVNPGFLDLINP